VSKVLAGVKNTKKIKTAEGIPISIRERVTIRAKEGGKYHSDSASVPKTGRTKKTSHGGVS